MPSSEFDRNKKSEEMDKKKKKKEDRLTSSRHREEGDEGAKPRSRRSTHSPKGTERKSSGSRKATASTPHRESTRSSEDRDAKEKRRNRGSRPAVPGAVRESTRSVSSDDDSVSLGGDNTVDVQEIQDQRRKGKERRSTRATRPGAVSESARNNRRRSTSRDSIGSRGSRGGSGGSRESRSGSRERRSTRSDSDAKRKERRSSRATAPGAVSESARSGGSHERQSTREDRRRAKERESKENSKMRSSNRSSVNTVSTNNPPPPTGAARRGRNVPPPRGAVSSEALGSGVSTDDRVAAKLASNRGGEAEIGVDGSALRGSVIEESVIATAVDEEAEVKPKISAAVVATQDNMEGAPAVEQPPKTPFYCKAKFWIVVLVIVVGGALGVVFMTQQNKETPTVTGATDPVGPEDPVTKEPTAPLPVTEDPSGLPTNSPTGTPIFDPPTPEECEAVANGEDFPGQEDLIIRNFQLPLDVVLTSNDFNPEAVQQEIQTKMQTVIMPLLIGCPFEDAQRMRGRKLMQDENDHRNLVTSMYVIGNAQVTVSTNAVPCTKSDSTNCVQVTVNIDTYLQGEERNLALFTRILEVLGPEEELASKLGLSPSVSEVFIVTIDSGSGTDSPTVEPSTSPSNGPTSSPTVALSSNPTAAPVTYPTTSEPTKNPTIAPSKAPSQKPTPGPTPGTPQPTPGLTPPPTPGPTGAPVVGPTPPPTSFPTKSPSPAPTSGPTDGPTSVPTSGPTSGPTSSPSKNPSKAPTSGPTSAPTNNPTKSPSAQPSPSPSTGAPSSNPSFSTFSGNVYKNDHYVLYWPDPVAHPSGYWWNTQEQAHIICNNLGLDLCPYDAVEGKNLCKAGWFSGTTVGQDKGYWLDYAWCGGASGYNWWGHDWAGVYCCGRPHYMPDTRPISVANSYVYTSAEQANAACATKGLQLCTQEQITGYSLCAFGWLADGRGYYIENAADCCCGGSGINIQNNGGAAGAYCCKGY